MAATTLGKTDRKLLDLLQKDGRITNLELAGRVALSPSACLRRVHVEDLAHFSRFVMDSLLKHPGVIDVKSSFALEAVKETTALPIARPPG